MNKIIKKYKYKIIFILILFIIICFLYGLLKKNITKQFEHFVISSPKINFNDYVSYKGCYKDIKNNPNLEYSVNNSDIFDNTLLPTISSPVYNYLPEKEKKNIENKKMLRNNAIESLSCINHCSSNNFSFYSIQDSKCYCGNSYGNETDDRGKKTTIYNRVSPNDENNKCVVELSGLKKGNTGYNPIYGIKSVIKSKKEKTVVNILDKQDSFIIDFRLKGNGKNVAYIDSIFDKQDSFCPKSQNEIPEDKIKIPYTKYTSYLGCFKKDNLPPFINTDTSKEYKKRSKHSDVNNTNLQYANNCPDKRNYNTITLKNIIIKTDDKPNTYYNNIINTCYIYIQKECFEITDNIGATIIYYNSYGLCIIMLYDPTHTQKCFFAIVPRELYLLFIGSYKHGLHDYILFLNKFALAIIGYKNKNINFFNNNEISIQHITNPKYRDEYDIYTIIGFKITDFKQNIFNFLKDKLENKDNILICVRKTKLGTLPSKDIQLKHFKIINLNPSSDTDYISFSDNKEDYCTNKSQTPLEKTSLNINTVERCKHICSDTGFEYHNYYSHNTLYNFFGLSDPNHKYGPECKCYQEKPLCDILELIYDNNKLTLKDKNNSYEEKYAANINNYFKFLYDNSSNNELLFYFHTADQKFKLFRRNQIKKLEPGEYKIGIIDDSEENKLLLNDKNGVLDDINITIDSKLINIKSNLLTINVLDDKDINYYDNIIYGCNTKGYHFASNNNQLFVNLAEPFKKDDKNCEHESGSLDSGNSEYISLYISGRAPSDVTIIDENGKRRSKNTLEGKIVTFLKNNKYELDKFSIREIKKYNKILKFIFKNVDLDKYDGAYIKRVNVSDEEEDNYDVSFENDTPLYDLDNNDTSNKNFSDLVNISKTNPGKNGYISIKLKNNNQYILDNFILSLGVYIIFLKAKNNKTDKPISVLFNEVGKCNNFKNCSDHTPNDIFQHEHNNKVKHHHHDMDCLEDDIPLNKIKNKYLLTHKDIDELEHHHHLK